MRGVVTICGRYTVFTEAEIVEMNAIVAEVTRRFADRPVTTGEIFPTDLAPVLWMEGGALAPKPMRWGFPKWDGKGVIINARAETAMYKNMFRRPLLECRCVIPSTGFYEWRRTGGVKRKDKYLLRLPNAKMLYMAGMAGFFRDVAGKLSEAYCILTTAASGSVGEIHDRMPVVLMPDELEGWLNDVGFVQRVLGREGPELVLGPVA